MAVHQPIHLSTDTPPSQASQLPQGMQLRALALLLLCF
jgi:hypothetical protein